MRKKQANIPNLEIESEAPTATGTTNIQMCTLMTSDGPSSHLGAGYGAVQSASRPIQSPASPRFATHLLKSPKLKKSYRRKIVV